MLTTASFSKVLCNRVIVTTSVTLDYTAFFIYITQSTVFSNDDWGVRSAVLNRLMVDCLYTIS